MAEAGCDELTEWQAYYRVEPFGEARADLRMARICWTVYSMLRGEKSPMKTPDDEAWRLDFAAAPEEIEADDEAAARALLAKFQALTLAAGGEITGGG